MSVTNADGRDLLNPNNPDTFQEDGIKLFYLKNGKAEEVYEGHLDKPKGYPVFQSAEGYQIGIKLNDAS